MRIYLFLLISTLVAQAHGEFFYRQIDNTCRGYFSDPGYGKHSRRCERQLRPKMEQRWLEMQQERGVQQPEAPEPNTPRNGSNGQPPYSYQLIYPRQGQCTSAQGYCVGDRIITRRGFKGTVQALVSAQTVQVHFVNDTINVSVGAIRRVYIPVEANPFGLNPEVDVLVRNIALTGECSGHAQCFRMFVYVNGDLAHTWRTSPGKPHSDGGVYTPEWEDATITRVTDANYESGSYPIRYVQNSAGETVEVRGGAPMPYAIFFNGTGIAIHGSTSRVDGVQRSHGCLRLLPAQARVFYELVDHVGPQNVYLTTRDTRRRYAGE